MHLSDDRGTTLVELLASMAIGVLTLLVVGMVVVSSQSAAGRVTERVDATQRGRVAMEQMLQRLRSQVCLSSSEPAIVEGEDTRVRFYTDLAASSPFVPERRELRLTGDRLVEDRWTLSGTTWTAAGSREFATGIARDGSEPVFRYYAFDPSGAADSYLALATPLSAADRARVVRVDVRFVATGNDARAVMRSTVYVRTADPYAPDRGPACL